MKRFWAKTLVCGALALFGTGAAYAQTVLYTTLPGAAQGGPCFGNSNLAAVQMSTPAGAAYQINSATVRMHHAGDPAASFTLDVYTNNAGVPGSLVATLGTAAGNGLGTYDLYNLTPAAPVSLAAATNYWVVARSTSINDCAFGWSRPGSVPTGVFTYVGEAQFYSGIWGDRTGQYFALGLNGAAVGAASVAAVPTLSEWAMMLMLSAVLFVGMRRLRR